MFFALDAIVRKCIADKSYAFLANNAYYTSFYQDKPYKRLKRIAPYFRSNLNYNLGIILAPEACFPPVVEAAPYYNFSTLDTFYKVCKAPNMLTYFTQCGGSAPAGIEYAIIGISKTALKHGRYSIGEALFASTDHNQPNFSIGFI